MHTYTKERNMKTSRLEKDVQIQEVCDAIEAMTKELSMQRYDKDCHAYRLGYTLGHFNFLLQALDLNERQLKILKTFK